MSSTRQTHVMSRVRRSKLYAIKVLWSAWSVLWSPQSWRFRTEFSIFHHDTNTASMTRRRRALLPEAARVRQHQHRSHLTVLGACHSIITYCRNLPIVEGSTTDGMAGLDFVAASAVPTASMRFVRRQGRASECKVF